MLNRNKWDNTADGPLYLLTALEYEQLSISTVVHCIDGTITRVGIDLIDTDTRFGMLAYGLFESECS